jgi:thymidylate kinase
MIIYLTGIDGSGKTTLLNDIEYYLNDRGHETLRVWARYTPKLAKIFVSLFKKRAVNTAGDYNSISADEYNKWQKYKKRITGNRLVRLFILALFSVDYWFQINSVLKRIKRNSDKTILIDRFVIDFLADQTVNLGDLSDTFVFRKYIRICDRFDSIFFITVEPETALRRKNDIPGLDYLIDRDKAYKGIIKNLKRGYIIDNSGPRSIALEEIKKIIQP